MNNLFSTSLQIHERYDLKGSTLGRSAGREAVERVSGRLWLARGRTGQAPRAEAGRGVVLGLGGGASAQGGNSAFGTGKGLEGRGDEGAQGPGLVSSATGRDTMYASGLHLLRACCRLMTMISSPTSDQSVAMSARCAWVPTRALC